MQEEQKRRKHRPTNSDQLLCNKINIALSDSNNSQNIECKIETSSNQKITISSVTGDKVWILSVLTKILG